MSDLRDLKKEIDKAKRRQKQQKEIKRNKYLRGNYASTYKAFGYLADFFAAIFVGGIIGYILDKVFDTFPWLFIALLFLGFIAGVFSIYRRFSREELEKKE